MRDLSAGNAASVRPPERRDAEERKERAEKAYGPDRYQRILATEVRFQRGHIA